MTLRLHRPRTLPEAHSLLSTLDNAMIYGGGTAIEILRRQGVLFAEHLVDLAGIGGLRDVVVGAGGVTVGSMVTARRVETDPHVVRAVPLASAAYRHAASPRVRNTASVGGNLAHGDHRLDPPAALLVLDATVHVSSARGERAVPVREFFTGFQHTALEPDELITAIHIPAQPSVSSGCYLKRSSLGANDWPCAAVAVLVVDDGEHRRVRAGLGALAPVPRYAEVDVTGLGRDAAVERLTAEVAPLLDPIPDIRGTVAFKRRLGLVTAADALRQAWKERT